MKGSPRGAAATLAATLKSADRTPFPEPVPKQTHAGDEESDSARQPTAMKHLLMLRKSVPFGEGHRFEKMVKEDAEATAASKAERAAEAVKRLPPQPPAAGTAADEAAADLAAPAEPPPSTATAATSCRASSGDGGRHSADRKAQKARGHRLSFQRC